MNRHVACGAVMLVASLAACGRDDLVDPGPLQPTVLSLSPATKTITVGDSAMFRAWGGRPETGTPLAITRCSLSAPASATAFVRGTACLVLGVSSGTSVVTAVVSGGASVSAQVVVTGAPQP